MIRYLRKLRQKLLQENRFSKYLMYAIGEIVLVVIGILIALQINNWNENRIEIINLKKHLLTIKNNINNDIIELRKDAVFRDSLRSKNIRAREELYTGNIKVETMNEAQRFFYEFYFIPDKSGYEALTNSGLLGKLSNSTLDSLIHKYYIGLDNLHEREISFNTFIENVEYDYRTQFPAIEIRKIMNKDTISEKEEKQLLDSYRSNIFQAGVLRASIQGNRLYYDLINIGETLVEEIDDYLYE